MSQKMIRKFLVIIACLIFQVGDCSQIATVCASPFISWQQIPQEDLSEIKVLFEELFDFSLFAYSLYGDKPMCFHDGAFLQMPFKALQNLPVDIYCQEILESHLEPFPWLERSWRTWEKYQHLFRMDKYALIEGECCNYTRIFFINRQVFKDVVDSNIDLFRQFIGPHITGEKLLTQFENSNTDVMDLLNDHLSLLGILLGFGRYNSLLFEKREALIDTLENPLYNSAFNRKKLERLENLRQSFHEHGSSMIYPRGIIGFAVDPNHPETLELRKKYDALHLQIKEVFSNGNWFEKILNDLVSK